jgi:hypothetical protein
LVCIKNIKIEFEEKNKDITVPLEAMTFLDVYDALRRVCGLRKQVLVNDTYFMVNISQVYQIWCPRGNKNVELRRAILSEYIVYEFKNDEKRFDFIAKLGAEEKAGTLSKRFD